MSRDKQTPYQIRNKEIKHNVHMLPTVCDPWICQWQIQLIRKTKLPSAAVSLLEVQKQLTKVEESMKLAHSHKPLVSLFKHIAQVTSTHN